MCGASTLGPTWSTQPAIALSGLTKLWAKQEAKGSAAAVVIGSAPPSFFDK